MVKRVKVDNLKNDNSSDIKNKDKVKKTFMHFFNLHSNKTINYN